MTYILGIETSCDETAAAVVCDGRHILSNVVASQVELHRPYGGVYPEVASRQHMITITPVIRQAVQEAALAWDRLDAVAVTYGPGLAGSLLVGVNAAKGLTWSRNLPLVGVNHLEGHVYSNWLQVKGSGVPPSLAELDATDQAFPLLILIVSGGHTELLLMSGHGQYARLGGTLDDAAGEAFDKVARLLGLTYPGGPAIQAAALTGDASAFDFPRALMTQPEHEYNFSFSGLKTAVLRTVRELDAAALPVSDLAASFQQAVVDALVAKTARAVEAHQVTAVCVCGGVAANACLRHVMSERLPVPVRVPPLFLCTDNAAMVAAAGHYRFHGGERSGWDLDVVANLRLTAC